MVWIDRTSPKTDYLATSAPTTSDNAAEGYRVGSIQVYDGTVYSLDEFASDGSAIWRRRNKERVRAYPADEIERGLCWRPEAQVTDANGAEVLLQLHGNERDMVATQEDSVQYLVDVSGLVTDLTNNQIKNLFQVSNGSGGTRMLAVLSHAGDGTYKVFVAEGIFDERVAITSAITGVTDNGDGTYTITDSSGPFADWMVSKTLSSTNDDYVIDSVTDANNVVTSTADPTADNGEDFRVYRWHDTGVSVPRSLLAKSVAESGTDGKIVLCNYADDGDDSEIYGSVDGGLNWGDNSPDFDDGDPLMSITSRTGGGPIRHLHGIENDYLMAGDSLTECSILVVDWDELFTDPDALKVKWALTDADTGSRDENIADGYAVTINGVRTGQIVRTVGIELSDSGDWYTYIDDGDGETRGGSYAVRFDPTTNVGHSFGRIIGVGRDTTKTPEGHIVQVTQSTYVTGTGYFDGNDEYLRLYALDPDNAEVYELARWIRADAGDETTFETQAMRRVMPFAGYVWMQGPSSPSLGSRYDEYDDSATTPGVVVRVGTSPVARHQSVTPYELIAPPALSILPQSFAGDTFDDTDWTESNVAMVLDTDVTCPGARSPYSYSITPSASGGYAGYDLNGTTDDNDMLEQNVAGQWVTLSCRFRMGDNSGAAPNGDQNPRFMFYNGGSSGKPKAYLYDVEAAKFDGEWYSLKMVRFVPPLPGGATNKLRLYIYPNRNGTHNANVVPIWVADMQIVVGTQPVPLACGNSTGI